MRQPMTPARIEVATSDYAIGTAPQILATSGVGSCVVICLYSASHHLGALLHVMLPRAEGDLNPKRFADTALSLALVDLAHLGATTKELTAKIAGGAQMFRTPTLTGDIGQRNVAEIRLLLRALGIPIAAEDVAGNLGRNVEFNLATGLITITTRQQTGNSL
jgi:chemotaxis protein CheD